MARSSFVSARIWTFLAIFLFVAGLGAQTSSGTSSKKTSGTGSGTTSSSGSTASLSAARTALAKIQSLDALAASLEGYAFSLSPHDAVTLIREQLPRLKEQKKIDIARLGGSLALMIGRYEDAAFMFGLAAREDPESGIEAARSYLAAGNIKEARAVLELLQGRFFDPSVEEKKKITLSWLLLLEDKGESAFVILKDMVSLQAGPANKSASGQGAAGQGAAGQGIQPAQAGGAMEKEALFLLWIIASAEDIRSFSVPSSGYEASALEALLKARYPTSVETAMIQRGVLPSPGAWLLGEVFPFAAARSEASGSLSQPGANPEKPGQDAGSAKSASAEDATSRLQVGWFSRKDNASSLSASLKKSGFSVSLEEQKTLDGQARWAVIVDAEADWTKTQAKLKDLGYESYLLP